MKPVSRTVSIATLGMVVAVLGLAPLAAPVFAWNQCGLTLTPTTQSTTVAAGSTVTLTYLLTYSESISYAANFAVSALSSNSAWNVVSVVPSTVPASGTSDSINQTISVEVTAPSTPGSTTTLTVTAVNNQDHNANCYAYTTLTAGALPPGVPQFPLGMTLLIAIVLPAMLLVKRKFSISSLQVL